MTETEIVGEVAAEPEAVGAVVAPVSATTRIEGQAHGPAAELPGQVE